MEITIDAAAVEALASRLASAASAYDAAIRAFLSRVALHIQREAQLAAPVRTGTLRRSITSEVQPRAARVGSNLDYARHVHEGRGEVVARPGGVLRFTARDGSVVFVRRVGPAAANPFLRVAAQGASSFIRSEAAELRSDIARIVQG